MAVTVFGIKSCDTVRKARIWLDARGIAHTFHDYRETPLAPGIVAGWAAQAGWPVLLNKASTTFKELPEQEKTGIDGAAAVALMVRHPTVIKRPVLDVDGRLTIGFKPELYAGLFPA